MIRSRHIYPKQIHNCSEVLRDLSLAMSSIRDAFSLIIHASSESWC